MLPLRIFSDRGITNFTEMGLPLGVFLGANININTNIEKQPVCYYDTAHTYRKY